MLFYLRLRHYIFIGNECFNFQMSESHVLLDDEVARLNDEPMICH